MSYLLIANSYPNKDKIYSNAFLHRRVKGYQEHGLDVKVVVFTTKVKRDEYYDGVHVMYMDEGQLYNHLKYNCYDKLLFHFINYKMFNAIERLSVKPKVVVWLHGFEAEPWFSRYYNYLESRNKLYEQLRKREEFFPYQKSFLQKMMTRQDMEVSFVYVSKAFKELYVDPNLGVEPHNYAIIPNIVDGDLFPYRKKKASDRLNILSIRPFTAKNYANDLTVKVIKQLKKKPYFKKLNFALYGDGPLFEEITEPIKKFKNVNLNKAFIPQNEISEIHQQYGTYIGPSRHDSQGVSLNEAMSSGLVPISNNIGGIGDFIEHGKTGFLADRNNVEQMVSYIDYIYKHPKEYLKMSEQTSKSIQQIAGNNVVINKELEVILG
ncbi:glycosyltransferase family 4 protein [Staphylococcus massiliensis]|uniref:glycosyltransferase family 4 protein n=1 Tax=Staphylococcus massiliensis TaxID=555791 RepID=UPI001EDE019E|nr:glycosyltransferase family 4 protein [Staphylococcus massiliensis]MCG3413389.1 glycosyltransferase family 4 protein [Staphylococcus massiliensis]